MQYITEIKAYQETKNAAVTLGKFDALHRGHRKLIDRICQYANSDVVSVVCAFDMGNETLLTGEERRAKLEERVDYLVACPFTKELREMEAETFIKEVLAGRFHASYIVVGTDFRFGHDKRGDVNLLAKYADRYGYRLDVIEKERYGGSVISSTRVREVLAAGDVCLADTLLGYPYRLTGKVMHGRQLGRKLGFPTMNVLPEKGKIMPRFGVYTCRIHVAGQENENGKWYYGIGNVGVKPTVAEGECPLAEVFAFDFQGDAYERTVTVEFCDFLRPETKFTSVEELKRQVDTDILQGRTFFAEKSGETF